MNSLFNKYEAFTPEGIQLSDRAHKAIKALMEEYAAQGFALRDIGHIISSTVGVIESELVLKKRLEERKKEDQDPGGFYIGGTFGLGERQFKLESR